MTSISQERANLAKVGLTLRRREQWRARFDYTNSRPVNEPADHVFCHISVTNPGSYNGNDAHIRAIENIGISRFSNTGMSYNRAITQDGTTYEGQPIGRRGAHTLNDKKLSSCVTSGCPGRGAGLYAPSYNLNVNARSYVIAQNVDDSVSDKQLDALARSIAADMLAGHVKRSARIHGHRCVSWKDCPGGRMWARMGELQKRVSAYVKAGNVGTSLEDDMSAEAEKKIDEIHSWLAGRNQVARPYKSKDPKVSIPFGIAETWEDTHALRHTAYPKPGYPKEGKFRIMQFIRWAYTHSRKGRYEGQERMTVLKRIEKKADSILAKMAGDDTPTILARIDKRSAEDATRDKQVQAQLSDLAEQVEGLTDTQGDIQGLLTQVQSGELDAAQVVRMIGELLSTAADSGADDDSAGDDA